MTVSNAAYLKSFHDVTVGLGHKIINSDFTFEIEGFERYYMLAKQCPWPILTPTEGIEVPTVLGAALWEKGQVKFNQQGAVAFQETQLGHIDKLLIDLIAKGGEFNAKIYEGTPQKFLIAKKIIKCTIQADPIDRDWENRTQPMMITGTMFYHYYGETVPGNSTPGDESAYR